MFETCAETVSVLHALIFGAGGACVDVGLGSLAPVFPVFVGAVLVLQFAARRALAALFPKGDKAPAPEPRGPLLNGPDYDGGPIRSQGR